MARIGTFRFRTPAQRNRSIVEQMSQESKRQQGLNDQEVQRLQGLMQAETQRQQQLDSEENDRIGREFKVEQGRQRLLDVEQRQQPAFQPPQFPAQPSTSPFGLGPARTPLPEEFQRPLPERGERGLVGFAASQAEQAIREVLDPIAALGLQIGESPIGSTVPGVAPLKALQAGIEPSLEATSGIDAGIQGDIARFGAEALGATLPRERTFGEAFEGGIVDPFAAIKGDREAQDRALEVLEEAGMPRAMAARVLFDPSLLLPGAGLTKVKDVARFGRLVINAARSTPKARTAAVTTLRESGQFQKLLRTVSEEAGGRPPAGPLRGGGESRFRLRTPEGVRLTNDIPATSVIDRRLAEIDVQLAKPKITGRSSLVTERAKLQAQRDIDEITTSGRPVAEQLDEINLELGELQTELQTRSVPFRGRFRSREFIRGEKEARMGGLSAEELARRPSAAQSRAEMLRRSEQRFPDVSSSELDARERVFREFSRNARFEPAEEPLVGRVFPEELTPARVGEELAGFEPPRFDVDVETHIAKADPSGTPPRKPPPVVGGAGPDDAQFDELRRVALKGEAPEETLIRRHQGAIDTAKRIAANEVRDNNQELVRIGLGRNFRGSVVAREKGAFNELNSLLHNPSKVASGELTIPDNLKDIYRKLRAQTDWEQAARIDFDPEMALVDDYFFRGWQPPEGMFTGEARGSLGRNPSFKLPRVDATYDEMIEAGFKPLFENPAEQARYSQVMGIRYREQMKLIDTIKESELGLPVVGGPVPKGWRVPRVGPAFEGKPYADGARTAFTRRWAVPDSLATRLENAYGVTPDFGRGTIFGKTVEFKKAIDAVTFMPKRAKLIGSVFQHVDFLSRSHFGAWTGFVDAMRRGQPIVAASRLAKWPQSAVDIIRSTFSPNFRARLSKLAVDDTPLWEGRNISNRTISEAGLSLRDETILPELDTVIRDVLAEPKIVRLGKAPIRALGDLERWWRQGLFDGVYPAAILTDIKNNIGPMILRQHPEATDAQLAGMIAKQANITYSTVPASISVIQNQTARFALTRLFFSLGENEGLLRLFTGAIRGENAAYFRTRWVGIYLGLITLASAIHFASTGKPLPLDRFTPISKNKWGPLPVGYNTNFAAPTLPIRGRGDTEITLDLVGQMDTAFRLLDPKSFLSARTSVPVRAFENQRTGKDFFGAPIDTVGPGGIFSRSAQLAQDLFAPIGPGQAGLEALRSNIEETEGLIQPGEDRLGTTGIGIQASGVNLRAEQTPALLDRIRGEVLAEMGITESYADIKANNLPLADQIDAAVEERIGGELELRRETSELRGQQTPQSAGFQALEATRERQQVEQLADDTELNANRWTGDVWREKFANRQRAFFTSREQIKEDFQITFDERKSPSKSVNEAIDAYFDVDIDRHTLTDGTIDWDAFFAARDAALTPLSSSDKRAVKAWLRKYDTPTPTVKEFRRAQDVVDRFFETPKYQELSLREGEILDELINERVEQVKRRELRDFRVELDTVTAIIIAAEQMGVSEKILNMALLFRERKVRDVFLRPERDEILFSEQRLLAKFYPDFLENQLSRAEEVTLGEPAFEAIAR